MEETNNVFKASSFADEEQLVFGWASVARDASGARPLDWQGDLIDASDLEAAVYKFNLDSRVSNDAHKPDTFNGLLVESIMFTKEKMQAMGIPEGTVPEGWWVGFKIYDRDIYMKVKNREYNMFSIEGSAVREECEFEPVVDHSKGDV